VRIVAPSGNLAPHEEALNAGILRLEAAGARVRFDRHRVEAEARGYLAGGDAERASEVLDAFVEPDVDLVWAARGGSGLARIAPWLVAGLARCSPRAFIGFSDLTTLLVALEGRLGWGCFHGPVVTTLGREDRHPFDLEHALALLRGETREIPLPHAPSCAAQGVLRGGNLTVLASLLGTAVCPTRAPDRGPTLWFLEDVAEAPYRLDRAWTQLRMAGALRGASAVWLGDLDLPAVERLTVEAAMSQDLAPLPVLRGAPAGHRGPIALLPVGAVVTLAPDRATLRTLEAIVAGGG
jgi:muramoyltetrapeptide carboxypeptidase